MSSEWPVTRLGDLVEIKHGWPFKSDFFVVNENNSKLPIVIAIGNFKYSGGFRFGTTQTKRYSADFPAEYVLRPGDILLVLTCQTAGGEILGIPARVPDDERLYLHNQRLGRVVLKNEAASNEFLYWIFLHSDFNRHLVNSASGTKILHTAPNRIESFQFRLPPLPEQRGIVSLLDALDARITLLHETNATLEAIAQALFKSWFVDFDPVRAKMQGRAPEGMDEATAALFPDGFEASELGEVPKGWKPQTFRDTIHIIGGGTPKTSNPDFWGGDIPWFSVVDAPGPSDVFVVDTEKHITEAGLQGSSTRLLPIGTTIISARGTVGRLALAGRTMAMNQSCYGLRGKAGDTYFTYFSTTRLVQQLQQWAHGSVFDTITQETFAGVHVAYPAVEAIAVFDACVEPLMSRIRENLLQVRTLSTVRDTLLPRLISGQIRMPEALAEVKSSIPYR